MFSNESDTALRRIFSKNLRRLCQERTDSLAQIARDLDLTPQQLNNYLSAKNLPSQSIRSKICRYFSVPEDELYVSERIREMMESSIPPRFINIAGRAIESKSIKKTGFSDGTYSVYFSSLHQSSSIIKSALIIKNIDNIAYFRRYTSINPSAQIRSAIRLSAHDGFLICAKENSFHFLGMNTRLGFEPSLMSGRWSDSKTPMLIGTALIGTPDGSSGAVFAMKREPFKKPRQAIRETGVLEWSDRELPRSVFSQLQDLRTRLGNFGIDQVN